MAELLRPFEREIIERFRFFGKQPDLLTGERGWKGVWIRGHLRDRRRDWVYAMWDYWRMFTESAERLGAKIKPGTYQSFRTYLYTLKKLGLVRPVPEVEPGLLAKVMIALGKELYEELAEYVNKFAPRRRPILPEYELEPGPKPVTWYQVVPEKIDDPAWMRPFQMLYPSTDWTKLSREEKRILRRKYAP